MRTELDKETRAGTGLRSSAEVERIVVLERLHLHNKGLPCGAAALCRHLCQHDRIQPLPSVRQISQVLTRYGLTHGRTGWYAGEELDWIPASASIPNGERR